MGFYFLFNFSLSFLNWFDMSIFDLFVLLENFPNLLWSFSICLLVKSMKVGILLNKMWVIFNCIHYNMKQCDSSTGIGSILFHVKKVGRDFVIFQVFGLLPEECLLLFVYFVQEDNTQDWSYKHVLGPFLQRKQLLNRELLDSKSWIRKKITEFFYELVHDLRVWF